MNESEKRERITANWKQVQSDVAQAAKQAGREKDSVSVIGVTKYVDAETTAMLFDAGCTTLGENRPQVLWQKAESDAFATRSPQWHLIGHVQRNKIRRVLRHRPLVHSVDSRRVLTALSEESVAADCITKVLLEVNISGDDAKTGFGADQLNALLIDEGLPNIEICGLMAMAGWGTSGDVAQAQFAEVRELRDKLASQSGNPLPELSMGMSGDFFEAIAEGATMVRIGSRLFDGIL